MEGTDWLWDSWFTRTSDGYYHRFQLSAPGAVSAEERHHHSRVRHFASTHLKHWQDCGVVLMPGAAGEWDDLAIWTGSVIRRDNQCLMYYTGRNKQDFWNQRIGVAVAEDAGLRDWMKWPLNPVLAADGKLYEVPDRLQETGWPLAFRDPYAFQDPSTREYYLAFSGSQFGKGVYGGCVGLAKCDDPFKPELQPPLCSPGLYAEMECPQIVFSGGLVYLFFSTWASKYRPDWGIEAGSRQGGLHCFVAKSLRGKFVPANGNGIVLDTGNQEYGHALVEQAGNQIVMIGFSNFDLNGNFSGGLAKPRRFVLDEDRVSEVS